jgi:hypothetical protein
MATKSKSPNKTRKPRMSADLVAFLREIAPLRGHTPTGDAFVSGRKDFGAICLSCGVTDRTACIRKHKKNCEYKRWYAALDALDTKLRELEP